MKQFLPSYEQFNTVKQIFFDNHVLSANGGESVSNNIVVNGGVAQLHFIFTGNMPNSTIEVQYIDNEENVIETNTIFDDDSLTTPYNAFLYPKYPKFRIKITNNHTSTRSITASTLFLQDVEDVETEETLTFTESSPVNETKKHFIPKKEGYVYVDYEWSATPAGGFFCEVVYYNDDDSIFKVEDVLDLRIDAFVTGINTGTLSFLLKYNKRFSIRTTYFHSSVRNCVFVVNKKINKQPYKKQKTIIYSRGSYDNLSRLAWVIPKGAIGADIVTTVFSNPTNETIGHVQGVLENKSGEELFGFLASNLEQEGVIRTLFHPFAMNTSGYDLNQNFLNSVAYVPVNYMFAEHDVIRFRVGYINEPVELETVIYWKY